MEREILVNELADVMANRGFSQNAVARALGISGAALSQWMSGNYKGNQSRINEAVKTFLERDKERSKTPKKVLRFVMTSAARKVFEAANLCHLDGEIGVAVGEAGVGKTFAVKEYVARNSDVVLVEADLGYTAKELFSEIHKKLGGEGTGSLNRMKDEIIDKLRGSGRLIVVDEAEHLPTRALDLLRRINDKAEVGILLVGLKRLLDNLRLKKGDFAYLYTRVGLAVNLAPLQATDIEAIVHDAVPGSNGLWKTFHEESYGNTRVLSKLIARSLRVMELNNVALTPEIVRESAKMLMI